MLIRPNATSNSYATFSVKLTFVSKFIVVSYLEDSTRPVVAQYYKSLVDWEAFENKQEAFQLFLSLLHVKVAAFLAEREEN